MRFKKLSIVIPAYNEEATILSVLETLRDWVIIDGIDKEILVVNDCSSDGTGRKIEEFLESNRTQEIRYIKHEENRGKGAAVRTGILAASGDYIIIQDADLEYDPREINILIRPILEGHADIVYGSRFLGGGAHRILFFWHSIGNGLLTFLSNMFTNLNLTDMETCYKLCRRDLLQGIDLRENRFGFEPEITAKLSRIPRVRIYEVGISYYGRTYSEGKKISWKDGFRAIYCIIKYNFWAK